MKQPFLFLSLLISLSLCFSCEEIQQAIETTADEEIVQDDIQDDTKKQPVVKEPERSSARSMENFIASMRNLRQNNVYIQRSSSQTISAMDLTSQTKIQYQRLVDNALKIQVLTNEFHQYIEALKDLIGQESDGVYTQFDSEAQRNEALIGLPKDGKNIEVIEQVFITGKYGGVNTQEQQGPALHRALLALRKDYLRTLAELWRDGGVKGTIFVDPYKRERFMQQISEDILIGGNNTTPNASFWVRENLYNKNVEDVYIFLTECQNQVNLSNAAIIDGLSKQMGKLELNYDKFDVFAQSAKPYVLLGETYESEIALGAYSSQSKFSVSVDGRSLSIIDGKAKFTARTSSMGEKTYAAKISVQNPLTGETESFTKTFKYEVGQPAISVTADKQNVLYIGVDNPITVAAAGVASSAIKVSVAGGMLKKNSSTGYNIHVQRVGDVIVTVQDTRRGKSYPFKFRVKALPNPIVRMGEHLDGLIRSSEMKTQEGLIAKLEDFDYDALCQVHSYTLYYTRKRQDPVELHGKGGRFSGKVLAAVKQAKPGDQYAFTDVNVRCSGDKQSRRVNGLAFKVK